MKPSDVTLQTKLANCQTRIAALKQDAADFAYLRDHYNPTLLYILANRREPGEWHDEIEAARVAGLAGAKQEEK